MYWLYISAICITGVYNVEFPACYEGCLGQSPSRKRHILADAIPGRTRELPCVQQHLNGISRQFQCVEKGNETWIWFENTRCGWEPTLLSLTTTHESNSPSEGCSSMSPAEILEKNVSVSAWPGYHQDGTASAKRGGYLHHTFH